MNFLQALERVRRMLVKEFLQTLRDPRTRFLLFAPPVVQMLVFGYAATLEVKHVNFAVLDLDNTQESRDFIARLSASRYFDQKPPLPASRICAPGSTAATFCSGSKSIPDSRRTCAAGAWLPCR